MHEYEGKTLNFTYLQFAINNTLICKVASTTWVMHFHRLSDGKSGHTHQKMIEYYHVKGQNQVNGVDVDEFAKKNHLFKFTFVRHPFDRLGIE